ncbi:MAG: hypothetical protein QOK10_2850 [Pseudonocardiales bacterium]|jgi:hypothetical protein|nr:hypothetical protein [Pseudonocardiales bacterium]
MHADRTNRLMLIVFALALIAAGGLGCAVSYGAFGRASERGALTHNRVGAFIGRNGDWLWPVVAVAALVVVLLALRWLLTLLLSTDRAGDLDIASGDGPGRTTLAPHALTEAISEEVEGYRGVSSAQSRVIGTEDLPELVLAVTVEESADLSRLRRRIETDAICHARAALGNPSLPVRLDLTVSTKRSARVA